MERQINEKKEEVDGTILKESLQSVKMLLEKENQLK